MRPGAKGAGGPVASQDTMGSHPCQGETAAAPPVGKGLKLGEAGISAAQLPWEAQALRLEVQKGDRVDSVALKALLPNPDCALLV